MKLFIAILFVAGAPSMATIFPPDLRYLRAYTEANCTGATYTFYDSVPDLDAYSVADGIKCMCYSGWWAVFREANYFDNIFALIDFDTCYQDSSLEIKSLRYIGSPSGLNDVYFSLYQGPDFYQGTVVKGNTNFESVGELDQDVSYLAITGQSPWTFYTGLEFTGASVCVYPVFNISSDNGMVMNYRATFVTFLELPDNSIRSVAQGCHSTRVAKPWLSQDSSLVDERGQIIRMKH